MRIEVLISGPLKNRAAHAEHRDCMHRLRHAVTNNEVLSKRKDYAYRPSVMSIKAALAADASLQPPEVRASQRALPVWKSCQSAASVMPGSHPG